MRKQKQQRFSQTKSKHYDFNSMILNRKPPSADKQHLTNQQYSSKVRQIKALKKFQQLFKREYIKQQNMNKIHDRNYSMAMDKVQDMGMDGKKTSPHQLCNRLRGMFFLRRRAQFQNKYSKNTEEDESQEQQRSQQTPVQGLTFYPLKPQPQSITVPKPQQQSPRSKPLNFIIPNSHKLLHKTLIPNRPHTQLQSFSRIYCQKMFNSQVFYSLILKANKVKKQQHRNSSFIYFSVYVEDGNNSEMIKSAIRKRNGWKVVQMPAVANMIWTQFYKRNIDIKLKRLRQSQRFSQQIPQQNPQSKHPHTSPQLPTPLSLLHPKKLSSFSSSSQHNPNMISIQQYKKQVSKICPYNEHMQKHCGSTLSSNLSFYNHIPNNHFISDKKNLLFNLAKLYEKKGKNVFQVMPFSVDVGEMVDVGMIRGMMPRGMGEDGGWIVKPGENSNRGRGIVVCGTLEQAVQQINCRYSKTSNPTPDQLNPDQPIPHPDLSQSQPTTFRPQALILQKYLSPLLYNKRKFDIRMYMLVTITNKKIRGYLYNEGYLRTSSKIFTMSTFDKFVHLTNDAIQSKSNDYGKFQEGNKISWKKFQKWMEVECQGFWDGFQERCKEVCRDVLESVKQPFLKKHSKYCSQNLLSLSKKIPILQLKKSVSINQQSQPQKNKLYYQLFGLDFLIDSSYKTWLIQINTNPALTTDCSRVVNSLIPKMIDNVFAIAVEPYVRSTAIKQVDTTKFQNNFQVVFDDDWKE